MREKRWRSGEGRTLSRLLVLWGFFAVAIPVSVGGVAEGVGGRVMVLALGVSGGHLEWGRVLGGNDEDSEQGWGEGGERACWETGTESVEALEGEERNNRDELPQNGSTARLPRPVHVLHTAQALADGDRRQYISSLSPRSLSPPPSPLLLVPVLVPACHPTKLRPRHLRPPAYPALHGRPHVHLRRR